MKFTVVMEKKKKKILTTSDGNWVKLITEELDQPREKVENWNRSCRSHVNRVNNTWKFESDKKDKVFANKSYVRVCVVFH